MNPVENPFAPGAGNRPPALAGRADLLEKTSIAIQRIKAGRADRCPLIIGLRGTGKTVLLGEIQKIAKAAGCRSVMHEAQENMPVANLLVPSLRKILLALDTVKAAGDKARRGLRVLKSFLSGLTVSVGGVDFAIEEEPEKGVADSGLLEMDLTDVFVAVGEAARAARSAAVVIIDELQYLPEAELGALIMAAHKISQQQLPVALVGAGLPQLAGNTGRAKSYAERLFVFPQLGALSPDDAAIALQEPARAAGVSFSAGALAEIFRQTRGYPYFLQEWGFQAWNAATGSPVSEQVAKKAGRAAIANLDESFFRVRFDRLTPREQDYLRALAELGGEPQRSGDIARVLGGQTEGVAPLRAGLISKGMIYSPRHGETAFTVPLFDEFMKRAMPLVSGKRRK
jgi:hypothetical protein